MEQRLTRIDLVVVGGASQSYQRLLDDYERRIAARTKLAVRELKGVPLRDGPERSRDAEGERILAALSKVERPQSRVIVCDPDGRSLTTEQYVELVVGSEHPIFIVGGAAGIARAVHERSRTTVSLGPHTMPHQLARLVLTEQIYRALTIARGEPYHH